MDRCRNAIAAITVLILFEGCAVLPRSATADANVDFEAHPGYTGLVIDRMDGGQSAVLVRAPEAPATNGPSHLLQADGDTIAALWLTDRDQFTVRRAPEADAPLVGEVLTFWSEGAIRLSFHSADGASFHSSPFERIDSEIAPKVLGKQMSHWRSVPGVYRAELYDAKGIALGWLRVEIIPHQGLPRHFDGELPEPLNGPLAAGAVALLNSEIESIRLNVFKDND